MARWVNLISRQESTPNRRPGGMVECRGLVVHTAEGSFEGTISWEQNPQAQVSSHFVVGKNQGQWAQMMDDADGAWTQRAGNYHWLSVENEGFGSRGQALTAWQVEANAHLLAEAHRRHGVPLQLAADPSERGLGHHSMGGTAWGHLDCLPLDTTEVLTPDGWVPLGDVRPETPVASFAVDSGIMSFNRPVGIVEPYAADLVSVAGFEMTPTHRLYVSYPGRARKAIEARELERFKPWPAIPRTDLRIPAFGDLVASGASIGADLMRLLVWVQADGHYQRKGGRLDHLHFHFSKQRKVERVSGILAKLGKEFRLSKRADGTTVIKVYGVEWLQKNVLHWMPDKRWEPWLIQADADEFRAVDEEIALADGTEAKSQRQRFYLSTVKANADLVQALYVTHGRAASVYKTDAGWVVNLHTRRSKGLSLTYEGARTGVMVSCLTTVDDTILIRQSGRVAVVGNCPGSVIIGQKAAIVARAQQIVNGNDTGGDPFMALSDVEQKELARTAHNADQYGWANAADLDEVPGVIVSVGAAPTAMTNVAKQKRVELEKRVADLAAKVDALQSGGVDPDAVAAKVLERLLARLTNG